MTQGPHNPNQGAVDEWGNPVGPSAPSGDQPAPPSYPYPGAQPDQEHQQHGQQPPHDSSQYSPSQYGQNPLPHQPGMPHQGQPAQAPHPQQAPWGAQPGQASTYGQQMGYQQHYGQPPYGYGQPPKPSNSKTWWLIGIITVIIIAIGVTVFVVMGGDDDGPSGRGGESSYVDGLDDLLIELDLTRESAIEEGGLTSEQYDVWRTCLIDEGQATLSADLKEKIARGNYDFTTGEETEFSDVALECMMGAF